MSTRKSISLPFDIYDLISNIKDEYEAETQKRHSFPDVVFMLANYYLNKQLEGEDVVEEPVEKTDNPELTKANLFIREALMELIKNSKPITYITGGGGGGYTAPLPLPEPEEVKTFDEDAIKRAKERAEGDFDDAVDELDIILEETGAVMPSTVMEISNPKHNGSNDTETPEEHKRRMRLRKKKARKGKLTPEQSHLEKEAKKSLGESIEGLTPPP